MVGLDRSAEYLVPGNPLSRSARCWEGARKVQMRLPGVCSFWVKVHSQGGGGGEMSHYPKVTQSLHKCVPWEAPGTGGLWSINVSGSLWFPGGLSPSSSSHTAQNAERKTAATPPGSDFCFFCRKHWCRLLPSTPRSPSCAGLADKWGNKLSARSTVSGSQEALNKR